MGFFGLFTKKNKETLDKGLEKTKQSVFSKLAHVVAGKSKVDDEVLDDLEEVLITSDVGVDTTIKIISSIEERVARDKYVSTSELNGILRDEISKLLDDSNDVTDWNLPEGRKPYVVLVVGVNGVGKTTTIGKLAKAVQKRRKESLSRSGRHVQGCCRRAVVHLGRESRSACSKTTDGCRPCKRSLRHVKLCYG